MTAELPGKGASKTDAGDSLHSIIDIETRGRIRNVVKEFRETMASAGIEHLKKISTSTKQRIITFESSFGGLTLDINVKEIENGEIGPSDRYRLTGDFFQLEGSLRSFDSTGYGTPTLDELLRHLQRAEDLVNAFLNPIKAAHQKALSSAKHELTPDDVDGFLTARTGIAKRPVEPWEATG